MMVINLYFVDLSGKVNKPKSIGKTQESLEVNVSNLAEGVYVLEVFFDKEVKEAEINPVIINKVGIVAVDGLINLS